MCGGGFGTQAGTFIDYASAVPAPGMTTRSLRPLLEGHVSTSYSTYVMVALWRPSNGGLLFTLT